MNRAKTEFERPLNPDAEEGAYTIPSIHETLDKIMFDGYYGGMLEGGKVKPSQANPTPFKTADLYNQWVFGKIKPDMVVVDFDSEDGAYDKVLSLIKAKNLHCIAVRGSHKGGHIYFSNKNMTVPKKSIGKKILLTLSPVDLLTGGKVSINEIKPYKSASIGLCKDSGCYRKIDYYNINEDDTLDEIPFYFLPVQGADKFNALNMKEHGGRNDFLHSYMIPVSKIGLPYEQYVELAELINQYIFDEAVGKSEFENATRKDEYPEPEAKAKKDINPEAFKQFLTNKGISIFYNELLNIVEYKNIPKEYQSVNDTQNVLPIKIQYDFKKYTGKAVNKQQIVDLILLEADEHAYNPVREYLTNGIWDQIDRFPELFDVLKIKDEFERILIRKWFYQTAALPFSTLYKPIQPEGVLILSGAEGIGKTRFFEQMAYKSLWFFSLDKELSTKNKDNVIAMLGAWISELGEIDRTFEANKSDLKNFMTMSKDNIRKPYAREPITKARTTSFCGTTNKSEILTNNTGYRRWWIVHLKTDDKINMGKFVNEEYLRQFWLQCHTEYISNPQCFRLTTDEQHELKERNKSEKEISPIEQMLLLRFDFDADIDKWYWASPAGISTMYGHWVNGASCNANDIGKALTSIRAEEPKIQKKRTKHGYQYFIPPTIQGVDQCGNIK